MYVWKSQVQILSSELMASFSTLTSTTDTNELLNLVDFVVTVLVKPACTSSEISNLKVGGFFHHMVVTLTITLTHTVVGSHSYHIYCNLSLIVRV